MPSVAHQSLNVLVRSHPVRILTLDQDLLQLVDDARDVQVLLITGECHSVCTTAIEQQHYHNWVVIVMPVW